MINRKNAHRYLAAKLNLMLGNYEEVIWLVGDGRSGTTWVSDLINHDGRYREMFEPFHPKFIPQMQFLEMHQYVRPGTPHEALATAAADVFSGRLYHARVDDHNRGLLYQGLFVKDIFANLFCSWAVKHFPHVRPVLLIRNPFAVALSKYKKRSWFWFTEPMRFLDQDQLMADHLAPFEDLIRRVAAQDDYILNQLLTWCVIHYVPLRQFDELDIHICFYEEIYESPLTEMERLFAFTGGKARESVRIPESQIKQPSRVAGQASTLGSKASPLLAWKDEIAPPVVDAGFAILDAFGFGSLYDDAGRPHRNALTDIQTGGVVADPDRYLNAALSSSDAGLGEASTLR